MTGHVEHGRPANLTQKLLRSHLVDGELVPGVQLTVTPGSRQVLDVIARSGVYADLLAAGARMLEPICGPCIGIGQAPIKGRPSLRTFNRNFPRRSGTAEDQVYLCSPSTAAATALTGTITHPRTRTRPAPPPPSPARAPPPGRHGAPPCRRISPGTRGTSPRRCPRASDPRSRSSAART